MTFKNSYEEMRYHADVRSAREWLETLVKRREEEVRDLRRYLERFDDAAKGGDTKLTDVLSWAVNAAAQAGSNDRLDLAVGHAARLGGK